MGSRPSRVTATGTAVDVGVGLDAIMAGARLFAGAGAGASAIIRETDASGAILAELQCVQATADECRIPISFKQKIHVTLTGAGASCTVYVK